MARAPISGVIRRLEKRAAQRRPLRAEVEQTALRWMRRRVHDFVDPRTGEVDTTAMVEAWDRAEAGGGATLDSDHPAWDAAVRVAEGFERRTIR